MNPRRGSQDKRPWRDLDLTAITGQTIEKRHVHEVYLGETVVPYATLDPLKAVLPLRRDATSLPTEDGGIGGVYLGGLERRMRERWQTISGVWEEHRARANRLTLLGQIDYLHKLSSQLDWQRNSDGRPVRVVQTEAGQPTAALLPDDHALVDSTLYWITCQNVEEAYYLLALINSDTLYAAVQPLMAKGQFGARHLHKQLWKLPIPEYDGREALHGEIAAAGEAPASKQPWTAALTSPVSNSRKGPQARAGGWEIPGPILGHAGRAFAVGDDVDFGAVVSHSNLRTSPPRPPLHMVERG